MEKYFITKNKEKKGPYSIEELTKLVLTDDYLIWRDGFENWIPITEMAELKGNVIISPPPTPLQLKRKNEKIAFNKTSLISIIWLLILWVAVFLIAGGFKADWDLQRSYGSGEYAIYGDGSDIRNVLIWASLLTSFIISCIIFVFVYIGKIKSKIDVSETNGLKKQANK